jgi:hypothetical protein
MKYFIASFAVLFGLVLVSCNKETQKEVQYKLKTKPLDSVVLKSVLTQLKGSGIYASNTYSRTSNTNNADIAQIIEPLVENGRELQTELISFVSTSNDWDLLPQNAKDSITNMTDEQLADLSLAYAGTEQARLASDLSGAIHDCVGVALGLAGIKGLMTSLVTAPTVSTAIGILKWFGKRYLSYIGVAWMVWDFMDCMSHF